MLTQLNVVLDRREPARGASPSTDLAGQAARLVPADGPHRRADDQPLPAGDRSATRSRPAPNPVEIAAYAREVQPEHHVRRPPGVGEDPRRRRSAPSPPTPRRASSSTRRSRRPSRSSSAWRGTQATDERARPPGRSSTTSPSGGVRELLGLDQLELAITGAAPIPAELLAWYRAIGVPLSEIYGMSETTGPMTWAPYQVKPGTVGPAIPGCEVTLAEDGEVHLPRRQRLPRLPRRAREDRRGPRRRRLAPLRRHRRARRGRLPARSSTARRS